MLRSLTCVALLLLVACGSRAPSAPGAGAAAGWPHGAMVSAANPYAADAAAGILRAGGSAVDAAIAAHAVLGLVEPQSSGLGGGAFMLVYERDGQRLTSWDGRETAPAGVTPELFLVDGEPLGFREAWQSGRAVGVPGTIALYAAAHAEHGRLPLADVLAPAIRLAREGFAVSPRLANMLARIAPVSLLDEHPASRAYFYPDGQPLAAGALRDNPDYADTLEAFARDGVDSFYRGARAAAMVAAVQAEPYPGTLQLSDLANYTVKRREALCGPAGDLRLCSAPPPASGLAVIMMLGLYDRFVAEPPATDERARLRALVDAQQYAYADRDRYVADPAFVTVPSRDLVDPRYLDARAAGRQPPGAARAPGDPGAVLRGEPLLADLGADTSGDDTGTTHLSIVDADGNAVALTASVEAPFGSSRLVAGFLLNNELTDFARQPRTADGQLRANAPAPGKRPRSSMSPLMVFDDGALRMVTGSPGGNSIPAYVAKSVVGVLRWGLDPQAAVDLPNVIARGQRVRVETGVGAGRQWARWLAEAGYDVQERDGENSGLHVVVVGADGLAGAADPRREGVVRGVPPAGRR